MAAVCLLIFFAYFLLRSSMPESKKRDRITAAYTIFAFAACIPLLYIIPRMQPSLHPGSGGNPGFGGEDLDNTMRTIFYPAIIGWTILAYWLSDIIFRIKEIDKKLKNRVYLNQN
jgi:heme exporter protein C